MQVRLPTTSTPKSPAKVSKASRGKIQQQQQQQQRVLEPYFCSERCQQVARHMAEQCAKGVVQVDALADGTPVSWQLIQPAAVAAALAPTPAAARGQADASAGAKAALTAAATLTPPKAGKPSSNSAAAAAAVGLLGTGIAAGYSQQQAQVLAQALRDVLLLLSQQLGPAWEVRSFQDTLPWIVGGLRHNTPGGMLDLSHFHVAVLWVGSTVASAALLRLHGAAVLELTLAATMPQLQRKRLGRLLVSCIERFALETCGVQQAWMPALGGVVRPSVGLSVLPTWQREADSREGLVLAAGSSLQLLGLTNVKLASEGVEAAGSSSSSDSDGEQGSKNAQQQQQQPKDLKACWALQLKYGPAPSVDDWMQLPKHVLLRYSYVPFVTKQLSAETLLPLTKFRKAVHAGPASTTAAAAAAGDITPAAAAGGMAAAAAANADGVAGAAAAGLSVVRTAGRSRSGVKQAAQQQQRQQQQQQLWSQLPPRASAAKQQQQQAALQPQQQLPGRGPTAQQQPLQPACFNFLTAQQLVHTTQQALPQEAGTAAVLGKQNAAGIAAGIKAYNSSSGWKGGVEQRSSSGGVVGVSGVEWLMRKQ
jgi:hypothetical protein